MKTLYNFAYFLICIRPFDVIPNYNKTNLLGIYMFKVDYKKTRTKHEVCLMLKLKNKCTRTTLSNDVLLSFILTSNVFINLILVFLLFSLNI